MYAKALAALVAALFVVQILTLIGQLPGSDDGLVEASGSSLPGGSFDQIPDIDYGTQYLVESISVDDLNGDSANDLLFGGWNSQGGGFEIHMQTAPGVFNFQPDVMVQASPSVQGHYTNTVADALDCNGDGLNDVAAAGWWNGTPRAAVYTQSAGPSFGFSYYMNPSYPRSIEAADVNNDGLTDITLGDPYNGYVDIYLQKPETGFNVIADQRLVLHTSGPDSLIDEYTLTDLNGDGRLDIVISYVELRQDPNTSAITPIGDKVAIFHQPSDGWPQVDPNYLTPETVPDVVLVEFIEDQLSHIEGLGVGDFNSDGHDDVAVLVSEYRVGIDIRIFRYGADIGEVSSALSQSISIQQSEIYNLAHHMKDLNQDGRVDLLFGHPVSVYFQTADGLISQTPGFTTNIIANHGLAIADLDQDRDNDIIAADGMRYCIWYDHAVPPPLIHQVLKRSQGPRASAVSWEFSPSEYGTWSGRIVNDGLRSLLVDVYDITTGAQEQVMHQKIRFSNQDAYPSGEVSTVGVLMSPVHRYLVTATPNGPQGSSCSVEDMFLEAVPVAMFTLQVSGTGITVNASSSYDPDGALVSYVWTFGDGGSGSGIIATHSYAAPGQYEIILTVTDSDGFSASTNQIVTILNPALIPHDPIEIQSDAEFTPQNGVVGGYGTAADPFLIQGWMIDAQNLSSGIRIAHTTAYFVINRVLVLNGTQNAAGVLLYDAKHGVIENVRSQNCYNGMMVLSSEDIVVRNCISFWNVYNGVSVSDSINVLVLNNTLTDQMLGVLVQGRAVANVTVAANTIYSCEMGVYAEFVSSVAISGNMISLCSAAIILGSASGCTVSDNVIESCVGGSGAIYLRYDTDCIVDGNRVESTERIGILVLNSSLVTLTGNVASGGLYGIWLYGFSGGETDLIVTGNILSNNFYGVDVSEIESAMIYGNDILNNTYQASQSDSNVTWDYSGSGNYWSDYSGLDSNGDGIGDIPYVIPGGGIDNYPLMMPCVV